MIVIQLIPAPGLTASWLGPIKQRRGCFITDSAALNGARVLITGGAGMIGSTIAHLAVSQGPVVTVLDPMLPRYGGNLFNLKEFEDRIEFIRGDTTSWNKSAI